MSKLQELKEVIQKANPEIMDLKLGCEVKLLFDDSDFYGKVKPYWVDSTIIKVSPKKAVIKVINSPFSNPTFDVQQMLEKKELKILGRPIRLADILLACDKKYPGQFAVVTDMEIGMIVKEEFVEVLMLYQWKDDNLDHQSQECIDFLHDLLCRKE